MPKLIDLAGQKFGRLFVIKRVEKDKQGRSRWLCRCVCKNEIIVSGYNIINGNTKSCGCLQIERSTKHGHTKNGKITREYNSWQSMKDRCTNPNNPGYKNYGGRKIKVCKRWLNSFPNFLKDMGKKPDGLSLDRKNNNKNYCKSNCRWATKEEQNKNKQNSLYAPYRGKRWLFVELCEEHNMPRKIVYNRYYNYGWTLEKALTIRVGKKRKK